ncbi:hypothetical protein [Hymenobacter sp. GOD-10R]|uniref:hypothetical protein n=1 Tax=Hymenobacter sp. GOD-10R TaxID=3093922 RepID=UPI002D78391E|nr:hypothetical protein [Hymenobacter sp. GOD-10R]WRQ26974.1 hypothetical protein SD425_18030 [Hymenobacter sp. GOD-10R]
MKKLSFVLALSLSSGWALAQSNCSVPVLKALENNQEVDVAGSALPASITLVLAKKAGCASDVTYQFTGAELTLVRSKRPLLPTMLVNSPEVDLAEFRKVYQTGDRLYIEVPGRSITIASTANKNDKVPLPENQGAAINWLLKK